MKQKMYEDVYKKMTNVDQKYGDVSHKKHTVKDHAKMTKNRQHFKNMRVEDFLEDEDDFLNDSINN